MPRDVVVTCAKNSLGFTRIEEHLQRKGFIVERVQRLTVSTLKDLDPKAIVVCQDYPVMKTALQDPSIATVAFGPCAFRTIYDGVPNQPKDVPPPKGEPCTAVARRAFAGLQVKDRFEVKGLIEDPTEVSTIASRFDVWAKSGNNPVFAVDRKAANALILVSPLLADGRIMDVLAWFLFKIGGVSMDMDFEGRAHTLIEKITRECPHDPVVAVAPGGARSIILMRAIARAGLAQSCVMVKTGFEDKQEMEAMLKEASDLGAQVRTVDVSSQARTAVKNVHDRSSRSSVLDEIVRSALQGAGVNVAGDSIKGTWSPFEGMTSDQVSYVAAVSGISDR